MGLVRSLRFPLEDREGVTKLLLGGIFTLLAVMGVGVFVVAGYLVRYLRQALAGEELPLPAWEVGALFREGLEAVLIMALYGLPLLALVIINIGVAALWPSGLLSLLWTAGFALTALALSVVLPAALLRYVAQGRWQAAFDFQEIIAFISDNRRTYIQAWGGALILHALALVGLLGCFLGVFLTTFWAMVASTHMLARMALRAEAGGRSGRRMVL